MPQTFDILFIYDVYQQWTVKIQMKVTNVNNKSKYKSTLNIR